MISVGIKEILAAIAVGIGIISYIPYVRDIFRGATKPHAFTWLVWALLTGIAFFAQLSDQAGAGAWVTGVAALTTGFVFILALRYGEKDIKNSDWWSLIGALVAMLLWLLTSDPLLSVILITLIDAQGFFPTVRKSWSKPFQETMIIYVLSSIKFVLAFFALETYTVVTWLYPVSLVLLNGLFAVFLVWRRSALQAQDTEQGTSETT